MPDSLRSSKRQRVVVIEDDIISSLSNTQPNIPHQASLTIITPPDIPQQYRCIRPSNEEDCKIVQKAISYTHQDLFEKTGITLNGGVDRERTSRAVNESFLLQWNRCQHGQ